MSYWLGSAAAESLLCLTSLPVLIMSARTRARTLSSSLLAPYPTEVSFQGSGGVVSGCCGSLRMARPSGDAEVSSGILVMPQLESFVAPHLRQQVVVVQIVHGHASAPNIRTTKASVAQHMPRQ